MCRPARDPNDRYGVLGLVSLPSVKNLPKVLATDRR